MVGAVHVDAIRNVRVIVNQEVWWSRGRLFVAESGQLFFDGAHHVVLKERVLVQTRITGRQRIRRTPLICVIPRYVEPLLHVRADAHGRAAD